MIGDNNWISTGCLVMHSVTTTEGCVFGARSILTRRMSYEPYCLYGGNPLHILSRNVMKDRHNHLVKEYQYKK